MGGRRERVRPQARHRNRAVADGGTRGGTATTPRDQGRCESRQRPDYPGLRRADLRPGGRACLRHDAADLAGPAPRRHLARPASQARCPALAHEVRPNHQIGCAGHLASNLALQARDCTTDPAGHPQGARLGHGSPRAHGQQRSRGGNRHRAPAHTESRQPSSSDPFRRRA